MIVALYLYFIELLRESALDSSNKTTIINDHLIIASHDNISQCNFILLSLYNLSILLLLSHPMKKYKITEEDQVDQGFETNPILSEQIIIHPKKIEETLTPQTSFIISTYKTKNRYKSTEKYSTKLANISTSLHQVSRIQRISNPNFGGQSADGSGEFESNLVLKRKYPKQEKKAQFQSIQELLDSVIIKNKKIEIAQNLVLNVEKQQQSDTIKQQITKNPNCTVVFRLKIPNNTYSYFKNLINNAKEYSFLQSKYNMVLKNKLDKYKNIADTISRQDKAIDKKNCFDFEGQFESGNIDFALKVDQNQYNVFLKIDTNTKGHQSWFYFKAINRFNQDKTIRINICNIKRRFKMMQKGQKIYIRSQMNTNTEWRLLDDDLKVSNTAKKRYKISFSLSFKSNQQIYISLIPPYTYSTLLKDIEQYNKSSDLRVDILTYSISGLAIPLLTVTKDACTTSKLKNIKKRKVFLISGRIHPSQTCSSFIINGLLRQLLNGNERSEQFLKNNVVKIVPMLNPDGVVFGNFRTNYLGDDLNRAFHRTDETIYPEIIALKELGKNLQMQFAQNFVGFLDMHGHSCQTNSFVYGPQHQQNSELYTECRIFPKLLDKISKYFKYDMSEFKLPEYKSNTARGYFLKKLKVPSYTIETSYSLFYEKEKCEESPVQMSIAHWRQLGQQIAMSLFYYYKYLESMRPKAEKNVPKKEKQPKKQNQKKQFREITTNNELLNFKSLKKEIEKEAAQKETEKTSRSKEGSQSESDGQSSEQDLTQNQRQHLHKKIKDAISPSYSLPKVMKASLALPSVAPSIWATGKNEEKIISTIPFISSKIRQKKLVRPFNITHEYTQYLLKNIQGVGSLKPQVFKYSRFPNREGIKQKNVFQQF